MTFKSIYPVVLTTLLLLATAVWAGARVGAQSASSGTTESGGAKGNKSMNRDLRERLEPLQYKVTQENWTEPAFQNAFWDNHEDGIYVDVVSGEPLFSSRDKFDSGTGWPSFTRPLVPANIVERQDDSLAMQRTEVRSRLADSHLGHVFEDGPRPTGMRYCINSAALRFIPVDSLETEGYGDFLALFRPTDAMDESDNPKKDGLEVAMLAGGCFWGMEDIIRSLPGVIDTEVGYTGGRAESPVYGDVSTGMTGHAEAVRIVFDPKELSYETLLGYFFRMHDPTSINRQGNDAGSQYRSAIFYENERQRGIAQRVKKEVNLSGRWESPIVTEIVPAGPFYRAEDYHQDYLVKHPGGYSCHYLRDWD